VKTRVREEQLLMSYLLGAASELEQSQIETRYFRDQRFYEELLAREEELICDYVSGALTPEEGRLFERNFLSSDRRRRKYKSIKKLMTFFADQSATGDWQTVTTSQPAPPGLWANCTRWLNDFFRPRLSFVWSTAVVTVLSLTALWLSVVVTELREDVKAGEAQQANSQKKTTRHKAKAERQSAKQRSESKSLTEMADQLQASLDEAPALVSPTKSTPALSLLSVTLRPSRVRGSGEAKKISIPANAGTLRLQLLLSSTEHSTYPSYTAVLKTIEGQEVARRQGISPQVAQSDKSLTLEVPASRLSDGYYAVLLTGITVSKELKPAEEFFIQIVRE
jgi:hypothetical protein